ncbi:hypothetical protein [Aurantiacibacter suaedae]|uniref:hypothetical protein n=1 Tax=Aurantiacibacter suaedae TaxID=2545755 RepID=UPI0010F53736|nr:hypothetical protein [Aurantiacibacter suaedae]
MTPRLIASAMILAAIPAAAHAAGAVPVDEASTTLLFAIGATGVLIGRHAAMRNRPQQDD